MANDRVAHQLCGSRSTRPFLRLHPIPFLLVTLGCLLAGVGRQHALAQDPAPRALQEPPVPGAKAPLSGEPAAVNLDPTRVPDYKAHRTDITDLLQTAINSSSGPLSIVLPAGTFVVKKGHIQINRDFVQIQGAGNGQTILHFQPDAAPADQGPSVLFVFQKSDNSSLSGGGIKNLEIVSDEVSFKGLKDGVDEYAPQVPSPHGKVAIRLVNTSFFTAADIVITKWWGHGSTGGESIGLQIQGREIATISRMLIQADIPIQIAPNADPALKWIGIDQFHFQDLQLIATGKNACVHILPDAPLTNVTFDGYQTWNRGGYGLKWDGHNDASVSIGLAIHNVRWEQATAPGGYMIYINHGRALYNLTLSNLNGGAQHPARAGESAEPIINGIYLRNVTNVRVESFMFDGTSVGIKLDQSASPAAAGKPSVSNVTLTNVFFPNKALQVDLAGGLNVSGAYLRGNELIRVNDGAGVAR